MNDVQTELEQLRAENARLKQQLANQPNLPLPATDVAQSLINDFAFIEDMARFAAGVLTQDQVRRKHHLFTEEIWQQLGENDQLVERIQLEVTKRIRSGATKRELAQNHTLAAPKILHDILTDTKQSAKHRIDSAKALNDLSDFTPLQTAEAGDRVIVTITLSADEKLTFNKPIRPTPNDTEIINVTPSQIQSLPDNTNEPPPTKRGPGRPPGSKNKPKTTNDPPPVPGFAT